MARGREERHTERVWSEAELRVVRNEAQGVAEDGCTAQGSAVPNQNCKKQ